MAKIQTAKGEMSYEKTYKQTIDRIHYLHVYPGGVSVIRRK
jgi:hypothetical protein